MKDVYVLKTFFGYDPLTKDEAKVKTDSGKYTSVDITSDELVIHIVYCPIGIYFNEASFVKEATKEANRYLEYVSSITGMELPVFEQ